MASPFPLLLCEQPFAGEGGGTPAHYRIFYWMPATKQVHGGLGCRYWRRIVQMAIAMMVMSAATLSIAGARQMTIMAISQIGEPPRGSSSNLRMSAP